MTASLEDLLKMESEEILTHNERPTADQLRVKEQIYYDDVEEGMELPKYIYHPTPTHLFRWSAAIENFHRIHYDLDFGLNHDRNPSILVHGSWKQSVVPQYIKDWTSPKGMALEGQVRAPRHVGAGRRSHHVGKGHRQIRKKLHGIRRVGDRHDHPGRRGEYAGVRDGGPAFEGRTGHSISLRASPGLTKGLTETGTTAPGGSPPGAYPLTTRIKT